MPLDAEVESAVKAAVKKRGQSSALATRLLAWLKESSERELSREDRDTHLQDVLTEITIGDDV
tara:strand:+ start:571 stop:759 length:189 start_codon:yes stop_codon:yes gene_type:complete